MSMLNDQRRRTRAVSRLRHPGISVTGPWGLLALLAVIEAAVVMVCALVLLSP